VTYVVTESCIKCKYTDCVGVCPVDCFYEGATMLVIHPEECIDCGVCVPECPVEAIVPDTDDAAEPFVELNRDYSKQWPRITQSKPPAADAADWETVPDKFKAYFSPEPPR
jgi:ferredoxin